MIDLTGTNPPLIGAGLFAAFFVIRWAVRFVRNWPSDQAEWKG